MYLVQSLINAKPHHSPFDDLQAAFDLAALRIKIWIWSSRCDQETGRLVKSLLDQDKYLEAFAVWNRNCPERAVSIHEFEFLKRNCHHDLDEPPRPDVSYLLEWSMVGWACSHILFETNQKAVLHAAEMLSEFTDPDSEVSQPCSDDTRRQVRTLIECGQYADAIDAWPNDCRDSTMAIHKIRVGMELTERICGDETGNGQGEPRQAIPTVRTP